MGSKYVDGVVDAKSGLAVNGALVINSSGVMVNASLAAIAAGTWTGATSITTLGTITTGIWNAGAITSSGTVTISGGSWPGALTSTAIAYHTAGDGLTLAGAGTTNDIVLVNKSGSGVLVVPTGTTAANFQGTLSANGGISGTTGTFSSKTVSATGSSVIVGDALSASTGVGRAKATIGNTTGISELLIGQAGGNNLVIGWTYNATPSAAYANIGSYGGGNPLALQADGGRVLIGTTTDDGATKLQVAGGISGTTGAFSGAVSLGNTVNAVNPTAPNRTVTIVVGGVTLYLAAKTTND